MNSDAALREKWETYLAVLGRADLSLLTTLAGGALEPQAWDRRWEVSENGRSLALPPALQEELLSALEAEGFEAFRHAHQQALEGLNGRLLAGEPLDETIWDALFERLASRLYANDRSQFVQMAEQAATLPLTLPLARQRVAFYLGGVALVQDHYDLAEARFAQLLDTPELEPLIQARALNARAVTARLNGRPADALTQYTAALAIWQQLGNRYYEASVRTNMGIAAYELRRYVEAEQHLHAAEAIFTEIQARHWLAVVWNELGLIARDQGAWEQALAYFDRFIGQRRRDGADHHIGLGLLNRGEVLLFMGDVAAADTALQEALTLVDGRTYQIDIWLHLGLAHLAAGELELAAEDFAAGLRIAQEIDRREILPHLYYHQGRVAQAAGHTAEALSLWERAVELIEASRTPQADENLKISLLGRWQQIYEGLVRHHAERGDLAQAFWWAERARARAFAEGLAPPEWEGETISLQTVQSRLEQGDGMVCYFTTGVLAGDLPLLQAIPRSSPLRSWLITPPGLLRFVITQDTVTLDELPIDPNALNSHSPRGQAIERLLAPRVLDQLGRLLWPAEPLAVDTVTLLPHGPLHHVPFAGLASLADLPLRFAPSATIWAHVQREASRSLADRPGFVVTYPGADPERRLHYAQAEGERILQLLPSGQWRPDSENESLAALREEVAGAGWLHFACHGWFNLEAPLDSYLEIGEGVHLSAREILETWRLAAELVVLSACRTGVSQVLRGDEPFGLVRAFLLAGARQVLVTQWAVDDRATFCLMTRLWRALAAGEAPMFALRQAQAWLRAVTVGELRVEGVSLVGADAERPFAHPRYWAGFQLIGG